MLALILLGYGTLALIACPVAIAIYRLLDAWLLDRHTADFQRRLDAEFPRVERAK